MNRLSIVGLVIVTILVVVALFAPWIATHDVGCVLVISMTYIVANTLTDMIYRWLDPRIRLS